MAEISGGLITFPLTSTHASLFDAFTILNGANSFVRPTSGVSYLLPISLLIVYRVLDGFTTACLLAAWPTSLSPVSVKATIEGVVLAPSLFGMTTGLPFSITATQE